MDEIRDIVDKIVRGCAQCGIDVNDVLAAFIARTIVETNASSFALDRKMSKEGLEEVVLQSIEKLIERDNPSLETMKMQVDYDSSFLRHDADAQRSLRLRNKMIAVHKMAIVEVIMEDANDFESLTILYRKIFRFLLDFAPNAKAQGQDKMIEREVAAALESVFPRVGLKAFVQLSYDEKNSQLVELARIVLGIRVFNREQQRGGAGIDFMDKEGLQLVNAMVQDIDNEVEYFTDACNKYQVAVVRAQLQRRRHEIELDKYMKEKSSSPPVPEADELVPAYLIDRWLKELSNRRQYLGFLRTLQDETRALQEKIGHICESISQELSSVKLMVTNRVSVPKELVYPRFDALGAMWISLFEEVTVLLARSSTFGILCKYRLSFTPTLTESYYAELPPDNPQMLTGAGTLADVDWSTSNVNVSTAADAKFSSYTSTDAESKEAKGGPGSATTTQGKHGRQLMVDGIEIDETTEAGAMLLSVHNTPDFMLLPLELQGYCPWTMVQARGLLLPGKPALGVVRFENMYYVLDHAIGIKQFMDRPDFYLNKIRERALANPEYIHLLRLHRWFPTAAISKLLNQDEYETSNALGRPATKDASTSTPTHFVESYIDINYHWNEWELRRRALKIANLKNCTTTSQQTDQSHFRRDNATQVYDQREKGTQTKRDKGTNLPIVTTYITGLRGKPNPEAKTVSKFVTSGTMENQLALTVAPGKGGVSGRDIVRDPTYKKKGGPSNPLTVRLKSDDDHGAKDVERARARVVSLTLDL